MKRSGFDARFTGLAMVAILKQLQLSSNVRFSRDAPSIQGASFSRVVPFLLLTLHKAGSRDVAWCMLLLSAVAAGIAGCGSDGSFLETATAQNDPQAADVVFDRADVPIQISMASFDLLRTACAGVSDAMIIEGLVIVDNGRRAGVNVQGRNALTDNFCATESCVRCNDAIADYVYSDAQ